MSAKTLPESLGQWPSPAVEFIVSLNRIRRASGNPDTHETASAAIRHARGWWRISTAHTWPQRGKRFAALEAGIEPALIFLNRHKVQIVRNAQGPVIETPTAPDLPELKQALEALSLAHLPVKSTQAAQVHNDPAAAHHRRQTTTTNRKESSHA